MPSVQIRRVSADSVVHSVVVALHCRVRHFIFTDIGFLVAMTLIIGVIVLKIDPVRLVRQLIKGYACLVLEIIRCLLGADPEQVHSLCPAGYLPVGFPLFRCRGYQFQACSREENLFRIQILRFFVDREKKSVASGIVYIVLKFPALLICEFPGFPGFSLLLGCRDLRNRGGSSGGCPGLPG